jgi:ribosomal protein L7/L12
MARRVRVIDTTARILAVKLVRELTGLGLKESLDHVDGKTWFSVDRDDAALGAIIGDARRNGVTFEFDPPLDQTSSVYALPFAIGVAGEFAIRYRSGPNKIHAIKLVRELSSEFGLKEAKDLVEGEGLVRVGISSSEADRIVGLFREIGSIVEVERVGAEAHSSLPPPSVPPPSAAPPSSTPPSGATAKLAKPARPATHIYGRPADDDDF